MEIRYEHIIEEQLKNIGLSYKRFNDIMEYIESTTCAMPYAFPVIKGTKLSVCFTNDFVENQYNTFPSLAIYFQYDQTTIKIMAVEESSYESYGI